MRFNFTVEDDGFELWATQTMNRLDVEIRQATSKIGKAVADEAKRQHPYTDRTYRLTRSIRSTAADGEIKEGYSTVVSANTSYAGKVQRIRGPILKPAFDRVKSECERILQDAIDLVD